MYKQNRHNIGYARYSELGICTFTKKFIYIFSYQCKCCFQVHSLASIYKTNDKVNRVSLRTVNASLINENLNGYLALITD